MFEDRDLYTAFYTEHLWKLLPEIYRASDSNDPDQKGPLRELVERLGAQAAIVRRSVDRTLEDQFIESCDDWLIPYIGDLLATNIVAGLEAREERLDVAKTIYYRQRKGTVGILEEIAANITGWNARLVEFFRRLARSRHNFDPLIGLDRDEAVVEGLRGTLSSTPAGGFADLRHAGAAQKTRTAFDEYFHTADFRRGRGGSGWHNIPKLGVFLWRLRAYRYLMATPVEDVNCPRQFTFDPTGREIPLFAREFRDVSQYGDAWVTPDEWMLPGKISQELLTREQLHLYPDSLAIVDISIAGETQIAFADLKINPERGRFQAANPPLAGNLRHVVFHHGFSSEIGGGPYDRRALAMDPLPQPAPIAVPVLGGDPQLMNSMTAIGDHGTLPLGDSYTYTSVTNPWTVTNALIQGIPLQRPVIRSNGGEWIIQGTGTATLALEGLLWSGADIVLTGTFDTVTLSCVSIDPGEEIHPDGTMPVSVDGRPLSPSTIWVEAAIENLVIRRSVCGPIRTRNGGAVAQMNITDSIIQGVRTNLPGALVDAQVFDAQRLARRLRDADPLTAFLRSSLTAAVAADLAAYDPATLPSAALITSFVADLNTVLSAGPLYDPARFAGITLSPGLLAAALAGPAGPEQLRVNRLLLEAAYPVELQPAAIATASGQVSLSRVTILGALDVHRLNASESILHGFTVAGDPQDGCVRFSAYVQGSHLHQPYESVEVGEQSSLFVTQRFGQPEYAQLQLLADREIVAGLPGASILSGAKDGSEMGAFSLEKNAIKERGLRIKFGEFMPIGLTPVLIYVT